MQDFTGHYGLVIDRIAEQSPTRGNYKITDRKTGEEVFTCGWLSVGTGQPLAFGDAPASLELGGKVVAEPRGSGDDGHYPGVKLHFEG